jgi:hypothetical protein
MARFTAHFSKLGAAFLCALATGCAFGDDMETSPESIDQEELPVYGVASDLSYVPRIRPRTTSAQRATELAGARRGLHCLEHFMLASYATTPDTNICGLTLEPNYSNEYVRLYSGVGPHSDTDSTPTRRLVVAFAGTHNGTDWFNNGASQLMLSESHNNPFLNTLALDGGRVGVGWKTRWVNQATLQHKALNVPVGTLVSRMKEHANLSKNNNQQLVTYVVGHSLGAATADVASYDIADWQSKQTNLAQEVVVAAFDMPRFGQAGAQTAYQNALKNTCNGPTVGKKCIRRWALTRTYDPVQSLPVGMNQIVWQTSKTEPARRTMGVGSNATTALDYCPQFNAPQVTSNPLKAVDNHDQNRWGYDINNNLSDEHLACMFGQQSYLVGGGGGGGGCSLCSGDDSDG